MGLDASLDRRTRGRVTYYRRLTRGRHAVPAPHLALYVCPVFVLLASSEQRETPRLLRSKNDWFDVAGLANHATRFVR